MLRLPKTPKCHHGRQDRRPKHLILLGLSEGRPANVAQRIKCHVSEIVALVSNQTLRPDPWPDQSPRHGTRTAAWPLSANACIRLPGNRRHHGAAAGEGRHDNRPVVDLSARRPPVWRHRTTCHAGPRLARPWQRTSQPASDRLAGHPASRRLWRLQRSLLPPRSQAKAGGECAILGTCGGSSSNWPISPAPNTA